jgi:FMN-dependent NADH-azoreductase
MNLVHDVSENSPLANPPSPSYPADRSHQPEKESVMTNILKIDASAQSEERSLSRSLTKLFIEEFVKHEPEARIVTRDVGRSPPPFVDGAFIQAAFTPPTEREQGMIDTLAASDQLIDEIIDADIVLLGAPMYNYGLPPTLKAWFDQVARIGRTFSFDLTRGLSD